MARCGLTESFDVCAGVGLTVCTNAEWRDFTNQPTLKAELECTSLLNRSFYLVIIKVEHFLILPILVQMYCSTGLEGFLKLYLHSREKVLVRGCEKFLPALA